MLLLSSLVADLVLADQDRWIERLAFSLSFLARASRCRHFSILGERVRPRHFAQVHSGVFLRLGSLSQLSQGRFLDLSACSKMALVAMLFGPSGSARHLQEGHLIDSLLSIAERVVHEGVLANLDKTGHLVQQGAKIATARLVMHHHLLRRWPVVVAQLAIASAVGGHAELVAAVHGVLHAQAQVVVVMTVCHVVMGKRELTDFSVLSVLSRRLILNDAIWLEGAD